MDELRKRIELIELRLDRNQRHTELVLGTQRERMDRAFEQVRLGFDQVRLALFEQEAAVRVQGVENRDSVKELFQIVISLDERLNRLENPPAA